KDWSATQSARNRSTARRRAFARRQRATRRQSRSRQCAADRCSHRRAFVGTNLRSRLGGGFGDPRGSCKSNRGPPQGKTVAYGKARGEQGSDGGGHWVLS